MQRFELKKYTVCTAVLQGRGSCRRASGPRQCVAGVKSSLALDKMSHADAYIVHAQRTLATLATANRQYTYDMVGIGIIQVLTRIGLFCCEARRRMSHVCLIKWEEKFITNEGRKI